MTFPVTVGVKRICPGWSGLIFFFPANQSICSAMFFPLSTIATLALPLSCNLCQRLPVHLWLMWFLTIHLQIPPSYSAACSSASGAGPQWILCLHHLDFQLLPGTVSSYTQSELMTVEGKFKAWREADMSVRMVINTRVGDPLAGSHLSPLWSDQAAH